VVIVNDGSTDETLKIAYKYAHKHPSVFSVIDKPNGGHGSTINAAIKQANGKYFKSIDSDDWVITENLAVFLDIL
jgi:glycosyltransferase involved in cell wall biosynthesis